MRGDTLVLAGAFGFAVAACGSDVIVVDAEGGGGGDGGTSLPTGGSGQGGGGAPPTPRTIEVTVESLSGQPTDEPLVIFVNEKTGALKRTIGLDELPAQVEVIDGDLVSFFTNDAYPSFWSYRVTPEVTRIVQEANAKGEPCDVEPMQVVLDLPPVDGADHYELHDDNRQIANVSAPGETVFEVETCKDTFDLLAIAYDGSDAIRHELVRELPFTSGGTMTVPFTLWNDARHPIAIELSDLDGLEFVRAVGRWNSYSMVPSDNTDISLQTPNGSFLGELAPILPEPGYGTMLILGDSRFPAESGYCDKQNFVRSGAALGEVTYSPLRLASARPADGDSWAFVTDGEPGDSIRRAWRYGSVQTGSVWFLVEDSTMPAEPAIFPELPADLYWPDVTPTLWYMAVYDALRPGSYADFIAESPTFYQEVAVDSRSWDVCE